MPKTDVRQDVEYVAHVTDSGEEQTIIEVYAPDTFGLLYRVAGEISRFGLNVVFAKIATRVDGVVDSFYVVDEKGKPFTDENKRKQLREQLLSHITSLTQ
jgi:[protein-PII] uridylyltransferase